MTKRALGNIDVDYSELDLTENDELLEWVLDHDFKQAPVVVVGDMGGEDFVAWSGFQPDQIQQLAHR